MPKAKSKKAETQTATGQCMKCKTQREFSGEVVIWKNGMKAVKGPCPECGTTINRILGKA